MVQGRLFKVDSGQTEQMYTSGLSLSGCDLGQLVLSLLCLTSLLCKMGMIELPRFAGKIKNDQHQVSNTMLDKQLIF